MGRFRRRMNGRPKIPAAATTSEDVQVLFDTATNEPSIAMERGCGKVSRATASSDSREVGAGPFRPGVTAINVRQDVGGYEITESHASRPAGAKLFTALDTKSGSARPCPVRSYVAAHTEIDMTGRNVGHCCRVDYCEGKGLNVATLDAEAIPLSRAAVTWHISKTRKLKLRSMGRGPSYLERTT
jgi:hypothetical protein